MATNDAAAPERTCVGCRAKRPQTQLVRLALTGDGQPVVSRTASGRGAWLCAENASCAKQAIKRRGFERAWKCQLAPTTTEHIEIAILGLAQCDVTTNMEN